MMVVRSNTKQALCLFLSSVRVLYLLSHRYALRKTNKQAVCRSKANFQEVGMNINSEGKPESLGSHITPSVLTQLLLCIGQGSENRIH